ncbi:unnamed protein product [Rotaria magnacalcarata]|uniref:Uncharacterized protein n=2 Tax=Rotaria magnacalcarata TaxID=392030 RepID=A0A815WBB5_9BILA|nr:unnamed protein product [Rotaria magnacalcarata]
MANTGNEVSASDSVSEILLKEQANKNDGGKKPPTYETLFSNTENPIQVHEQSQSRYQNTPAVIMLQSSPTQSMDHIKYLLTNIMSQVLKRKAKSKGDCNRQLASYIDNLSSSVSSDYQTMASSQTDDDIVSDIA